MSVVRRRDQECPISVEARRLLQMHGGLLAGDPPIGDPLGQARAVEALDAARARLRGSEQPSGGQLTLDLRGVK